MKDIDKHKVKIEEVGSENIFKTPEGFFEDLPLAIQTRIYGQVVNKSIRRWAVVLQYATPAMFILICLLLWLSWPIHKTPETLLAQVDEAVIMEYLQLSDISTEELLQNIEINQVGLNWGDEPLIDQLQIDEGTIEMFEQYGIDGIKNLN